MYVARVRKVRATVVYGAYVRCVKMDATVRRELSWEVKTGQDERLNQDSKQTTTRNLLVRGLNSVYGASVMDGKYECVMCYIM